MPKYLYREGIITRFFDKFFDSIKKRAGDDMIKAMLKADPELAKELIKIKKVLIRLIKKSNLGGIKKIGIIIIH